MNEYVALLRGITPMNAKMSELAKAFESAGFKEVRTVLGSGNLIFRAAAATEESIERRAEAAMQKKLGRTFPAIVRSMEALRKLLASDPYKAFTLKPGSKRVVTFLRKKSAQKVTLPIELDGARILALKGAEIFTVYVASPRGPVFMTLIERTFGKEVTTRTWDTLVKIAARSAAREGV